VQSLAAERVPLFVKDGEGTIGRSVLVKHAAVDEEAVGLVTERTQRSCAGDAQRPALGRE
jgi:hypothetical protein